MYCMYLKCKHFANDGCNTITLWQNFEYVNISQNKWDLLYLEESIYFSCFVSLENTGVGFHFFRKAKKREHVIKVESFRNGHTKSKLSWAQLQTGLHNQFFSQEGVLVFFIGYKTKKSVLLVQKSLQFPYFLSRYNFIIL